MIKIIWLKSFFSPIKPQLFIVRTRHNPQCYDMVQMLQYFFPLDDILFAKLKQVTLNHFLPCSNEFSIDHMTARNLHSPSKPTAWPLFTLISLKSLFDTVYSRSTCANYHAVLFSRCNFFERPIWIKVLSS